MGLFTNKNSINLFEISNKNLFSKDSIFFNNAANLSSESSTVGKIFGTSQSLFNKSKDDGGESGNEEDSAQLEADQKEALDPSKSTGNFQYNFDSDILFHEKLSKFKKDNGELIEGTEVSLLEKKDKSARWLVIRLSATKK